MWTLKKQERKHITSDKSWKISHPLGRRNKKNIENVKMEIEDEAGGKRAVTQ